MYHCIIIIDCIDCVIFAKADEECIVFFLLLMFDLQTLNVSNKTNIHQKYYLYLLIPGQLQHMGRSGNPGTIRYTAHDQGLVGEDLTQAVIQAYTAVHGDTKPISTGKLIYEC